MSRLYKFTPNDFKPLPVEVIHMDLSFNVYDKHTDVLSVMKLKNKDKPLKKLELNAKNLEIFSVECSFCKIKYNYKEKEHKLVIHFSKPIPKRQDFTIKTITKCKPSYHVLEGLYYDATPKGCPPTQITQCQQWGFQRLLPCFDDMTAKCTYTTTITADKRYTHILTNGDVAEERKNVGSDRDMIVYDNSTTPMAPYLFFLGVGTYDAFQKEFEYPDGNKFIIELLLFPGEDRQKAEKSLDILYDAILWTYVFTGPDMYKQVEKRNEIEKLMRKRDLLKRQKESKKRDKELADIRKKLTSVTKKLRFGYKYTGSTYREIAMQNSDFGGMENVGNTTISSNRIIPFDQIPDPSFEYMIRVKVHEYYHNINGSEVTGKDPFQLWLNEAVTCFIEHKYLADINGEDYMRLQYALSLIDPSGVFAKDSGATTMPVIPDGFNDPNELISLVTYVKSPEFVRMLEIMMGKDTFARALHLYHKTYSHKNADTNDFLQAMEKTSKLKLKRMFDVWLKQTGFPKLHVKTNYKNNNLIIDLTQKGFRRNKHWEFPLKFALVDKDGKDYLETIEIIKKPKQKIILKNVEKPAFISFNRGFSFYGQVIYKQSIPDLMIQVEKDSDAIAKFMAFQKLWDLEKTALIKNEKMPVSDAIIDLYFKVLSGTEPEQGALLLAITDFVEEQKYAYQYDKIYLAKKRILKAIAKKYKKELLEIYKKLSKKRIDGFYVDRELKYIKIRQLKNLCLLILAQLDTPEVHKMIKQQFERSKPATDKMAALKFYLNSKASGRIKMLERYEKKAASHPVSFETFLAVVGTNDSADNLDIIKRVERSKHFDINQSNHQRALYNSFAINRKKSLLTKQGLAFLQETLIKLSKINEYSCINILEAFNQLNNLEPQHQVNCVQTLLHVLDNIDKETAPSVFNTTRRILIKSPKALKAYEKKFKKVKL